MRILHTSDWHLGKSLGSKSRLEEQRSALEHLVSVCKTEKIDVLLVCGDIFDTFVPKAEAEELFFLMLIQLSRLCTVVCLSGNHDDGDRLQAPRPIAVYSDIFLSGRMDNTAFKSKNITGGDGFLTITKNDERLNLAILPYPFFSAIISQAEGENNEERITGLINRCTSCFKEGEINIFASHLFVEGGQVAEDAELGSAPLVPVRLMPKCDYIALGHIHRPQTVSKSKNIVYSGSLLKYSFDDVYDKFFYIFDSSDKSIKKVALPQGKKLVSASVSSFLEAERVLTDNQNAYVKLIYSGNPLELSQIKKIKSYPCFTDIRFENLREGIKRTVRADSSPTQLFKSFYNSLTGNNPDDDLTELFLSVLGGNNETA